MPDLEIPCRRKRDSWSRASDYDVIEYFNKPSEQYFREILGKLIDQDLLTDSEVAWFQQHRNCIANYDRRAFTHCMRVALITYLLARYNEKSEEFQAKAFIVGFTHDIGKTYISRRVLFAPWWMWTLMRKRLMKKVRLHVIYGYFHLLAEEGRFVPFCAEVALFHHMRQRGPYPSFQDLIDNDVPLSGPSEEAREVIDYVTIADLFDGSQRKDKPWWQSKARQEYLKNRQIENLKEKLPEYHQTIDYVFNEMVKLN